MAFQPGRHLEFYAWRRSVFLVQGDDPVDVGTAGILVQVDPGGKQFHMFQHHGTVGILAEGEGEQNAVFGVAVIQIHQ